MVVLLALAAACAFALGNVLQQKGTLEAPAGDNDPRFLVQIFHRPVWLVGGALQAVGWILQAAALDRGSLVVVQALTATSLVIALPLGARLTDQRIDRRVGLAALATVVGIVLFLSVGSPQGGTEHPDAAAWWSASVTAAVIIVVLAWLGRSRSSAPRALFFGSAAGVGFALQSSVTKQFTTVLGHGIGAVLTSWTIYVLIISAIVGLVLQQSALRTGVLAPAMASSNAVTLFASVLFGISLFGEKISNGNSRIAPAVIGLVLALVGISLLASAEPAVPAPPRPGAVDPPPVTGAGYA
jgi:drug/metabolite transporter (DMT)-like permease